MPLTIFLHRIGRQRIVETRLNKVLVLGLEAECPPAWPACSSPGAIWLGYVPNLPARACWMDALRRDSPTPVCSLCVTVCMVLCHLGCTCASVFFTSTWVCEAGHVVVVLGVQDAGGHHVLACYA